MGIFLNLLNDAVKFQNRLWRKNRFAGNVMCVGTDVNRNFPFRWGYTSHVSLPAMFNIQTRI